MLRECPHNAKESVALFIYQVSQYVIYAFEKAFYTTQILRNVELGVKRGKLRLSPKRPSARRTDFRSLLAASAACSKSAAA